MSHRNFTFSLLVLTAALSALVLWNTATVMSDWKTSDLSAAQFHEYVAALTKAGISVLSGLMTLCTLIWSGGRLRVAFLLSVGAAAVLAPFAQFEFWPAISIPGILLGAWSLSRLPLVGRFRGATAAITGVSSIVLSLVAVLSWVVFAYAVPAIFEGMIRASAKAYSAPAHEVEDLITRLAPLLSAAESLSYVIPAAIWVLGTLFLASFHDARRRSAA